MSKTKTNIRFFEMLNTAFGKEIIRLMNDPDVTEIILNADGKLWAESYTKGKYFTENVLAPEQAGNIIKLVAAIRNNIADTTSPEVACDLPETLARFEGWLPPVVINPVFTIRKRATHIFNLDDYIKNNFICAEHALSLRAAIREHKNILIAGGTASGKTTFANALLHELKDSEERIIILEDLPELQISVKDHLKLTTTNNVSMRDLIKGILRMRPDRIIIGEVRDGAALDLLKAWNTGHPGGICTIHANSPEATLLRLEDLVREVATHVPQHLINEAIDIIVFMRREGPGKYKVTDLKKLH